MVSIERILPEKEGVAGNKKKAKRTTKPGNNLNRVSFLKQRFM